MVMYFFDVNSRCDGRQPTATLRLSKPLMGDDRNAFVACIRKDDIRSASLLGAPCDVQLSA